MTAHWEFVGICIMENPQKIYKPRLIMGKYREQNYVYIFAPNYIFLVVNKNLITVYILYNRKKMPKKTPKILNPPNLAQIPRESIRKWVQFICSTRKPYDSHQNFDSKCIRKKVSWTTYGHWRPSWILAPRPLEGQFFFVPKSFIRKSIVIRSYLCRLKLFTLRCTHPPTYLLDYYN